MTACNRERNDSHFRFSIKQKSMVLLGAPSNDIDTIYSCWFDQKKAPGGIPGHRGPMEGSHEPARFINMIDMTPKSLNKKAWSRQK